MTSMLTGGRERSASTQRSKPRRRSRNGPSMAARSALRPCRTLPISRPMEARSGCSASERSNAMSRKVLIMEERLPMGGSPGKSTGGEWSMPPVKASSPPSFERRLNYSRGARIDPPTAPWGGLPSSESPVMIVLTSLVVLVVGFWLFFALSGVVLKLAFGLIGGVFSILGSVLGAVIGGVVMLAIAPVIALALLPVLLPVALLAVIVWAIARATRKPDVVVMPR